jgi:hypothetical protein
LEIIRFGYNDKRRLFVPGTRAHRFHFRHYLIAASAGAAVALLNYFIGLWLMSRGLHAELTFVDEFLLAIFTSVLVFVIELSHQRHQELILRRVKTIELMNHHIRNALQNIIDSTYLHGNFEEIRSSVERRHWALEEILPGQVLDAYEHPRQDHPAARPTSQMNPGA